LNSTNIVHENGANNSRSDPYWFNF